jgi:predicted dehydrogenase
MVVNRRDFLRVGAGAGLAAALASRSARSANKAAARKPLRIGFIGTGGRGSSDLRDALKAEGVEVVAICDITPANLKNGLDIVENRTGKRPEGMGDYPYQYRQLLKRDDIDCVVIATPCYWHEVMYVDALNAGKSFYGEKPLAITAGGVKAVNEAARKNPKVVVQIGFQWGATPARRDIINKIHEGVIGELLDGRFQRLNGWDGHGGWYTNRSQSGDWMLEQAVHEFNLMWMVAQANPVSCYAAGRSGIIPGRDTTNYYTAVFQYGDSLKNLILHYCHGWIEVPGFAEGSFRAEFVGTKGAAEIMKNFIQLRQKPATGEAKILGQGGEGDTPEHLENFFECVRNGTPEKANCGIANGTGASIIGLMIRQSLEQKRPVTFEETMADTRTVPVPPV